MSSLSRVSGCVVAVCGATAFGAEIEPSISLGLVHTDNLTLASTNPESADILELIPGITVSQESARISADAAYRAEGYHYQERDENEVFHLFDGTLKVDIVPDRFFFDTGGSRTKAIVDPESSFSPSDLHITGNRVDRDDYYAGPSFEVGAGGNAVVRGEARRTWISYGEVVGPGQLDDYHDDDISIGVDNYSKGIGVTWAARYDRERTEYEEAAILPFEYRQAALEIGFWATEGFRVFATAGKESPWDRPLEPELEDSLWEVGAARNLGERFNIEVAFGDRSFGSSQRADFEYDFGRGSTSISYGQTPTTNSRDTFSSGLLDPDDPNDYLARAGSVERYISDRFQWDLNLELSRATFGLVLFDEERQERTQADGTPLPDEKQSGANVSFSLELGSRTEFFVRGYMADQEFADGDEGELAEGSTGVIYSLGRRTQLALDFTSLKQQFGASRGSDYRAQTVSLSATRVFRR